MKKFASILRDVGFVFFTIFILFMIILMSSGKHVSIAGYQVLRVLTSSMEPTISENTCIIIKKYPVDQLKVGDVITFTSDDPQIQGLYNTHRIHDIVEENGETLYVTKGDAIDAVDAYPVHQNQVAGIFVKELPGGRLLGKCFVALSDNRIYFLVIILPLMLCLMSYFWQIMGMFRKSEEDEDEDEDELEEDETETSDYEREGLGNLTEQKIKKSQPGSDNLEKVLDESHLGGESSKDNTGMNVTTDSSPSLDEDYRYTAEDLVDTDYKY